MKRHPTLSPILATLLATLLAACGDDQQQPAPGGSGQPGTGQARTPPGDGHGTATDLGKLTVAGREFRIVRLGELVPGKEGALEVYGTGMSDTDLQSLNAYLWVESEDGTQLSSSEKGLPGGGRLHFHVTPRKGDKTPFRVVLRLRADGTDERASLPLSGHGHEHVEGPHHGVPATFSGGETKGYLELKLHDDKGDLELWLAEDAGRERPFDLPLDAVVEIEFVDVQGRKVTLRPRDTTTNEDEDGTPNIHDGKTHYFIFPSQDGEDASWLTGKEFQSIVIVRFSRGGQAFASEEFVLKPHSH
ncbi:MAG: hypothetical protein IPM29_03865 [Planctomycetes bacterium]|nr:hypothetical protein [Planctomycetota bacterium]